MFSKILIANRGEIACRVIGTARRMGIATVAVYSEADAGALHVAMADEAYLIGPAPPRDSYLNIGAILDAVRRSGAAAVHPGYGFLSENAGFAEACAGAGATFIGPPPAAIRAMGSKAAAKALMETRGVPVVPGYHGDDQDAAHLLAQAERIGFPVLLKASSGGGGRGMRIVGGPGEFSRALDGARREAASAFGDDRILIERYLSRPRHIEVQVFGDTRGNFVHLFERDCSIQRRYQKVVEEAPAPGLDSARGRALGEAAIMAARAVAYVGAGTIEFIADQSAFYFMEMNTRLQVEHPVTEAITGLDLVEWQLRVAAGERLPLTQDEIARRGHAIEVRLYAENPDRNFLPATGTLHGLRFPRAEDARVDTGFRQGDAVTPFYDPLIAKIVAWGADRGAARGRLARALNETAVLGVTTNLGFLRRVVADAEFAAGAVDTAFIERRRDGLLPAPAAISDAALAAAALRRLSKAAAVTANEHPSPWGRVDGWRLNAASAPIDFAFQVADEGVTVQATADGGVWILSIADREYRAIAAPIATDTVAVTLDGSRRTALVLEYGGVLSVTIDGVTRQLETVDPLAPPAGSAIVAGRLTAPMPGRVVQVLVAAGDAVRRGQPLMVVEAMKMEHTIAAPRDGVVDAVRYGAGDLVEEGAELIALSETGPEGGG